MYVTIMFMFVFDLAMTALDKHAEYRERVNCAAVTEWRLSVYVRIVCEG